MYFNINKITILGYCTYMYIHYKWYTNMCIHTDPNTSYKLCICQNEDGYAWYNRSTCIVKFHMNVLLIKKFDNSNKLMKVRETKWENSSNITFKLFVVFTRDFLFLDKAKLFKFHSWLHNIVNLWLCGTHFRSF